MVKVICPECGLENNVNEKEQYADCEACYATIDIKEGIKLKEKSKEKSNIKFTPPRIDHDLTSKDASTETYDHSSSKPVHTPPPTPTHTPTEPRDWPLLIASSIGILVTLFATSSGLLINFLSLLVIACLMCVLIGKYNRVITWSIMGGAFLFTFNNSVNAPVLFSIKNYAFPIFLLTTLFIYYRTKSYDRSKTNPSLKAIIRTIIEKLPGKLVYKIPVMLLSTLFVFLIIWGFPGKLFGWNTPNAGFSEFYDKLFEVYHKNGTADEYIHAIQKSNRKLASDQINIPRNIRVGMSRDTVRKLLGEPINDSNFDYYPGDAMAILYNTDSNTVKMIYVSCPLPLSKLPHFKGSVYGIKCGYTGEMLKEKFNKIRVLDKYSKNESRYDLEMNMNTIRVSVANRTKINNDNTGFISDMIKEMWIMK